MTYRCPKCGRTSSYAEYCYGGETGSAVQMILIEPQADEPRDSGETR